MVNEGRGGYERGGYERKTPPAAYICHRCKVPGMLMLLAFVVGLLDQCSSWSYICARRACLLMNTILNFEFLSPGHFIQHCPTNGDPNYDVRKAKPPTGIPKSMLMATPDGSYALPSGAAAVLKPNE